MKPQNPEILFCKREHIHEIFDFLKQSFDIVETSQVVGRKKREPTFGFVIRRGIERCSVLVDPPRYKEGLYWITFARGFFSNGKKLQKELINETLKIIGNDVNQAEALKKYT